MAKPGQGMPAKFEGTCPVCEQTIAVGELIEKIPQYDDKRGHLECYRLVQAKMPARAIMRDPAPQQQQQPQQGATVLQHPATRPATTGPRASSPSAAIDDFVIQQLWQLKDAMTMIGQGAIQAAVAIENIAKTVDPHQAKAPPGAERAAGGQ